MKVRRRFVVGYKANQNRGLYAKRTTEGNWFQSWTLVEAKRELKSMMCGALFEIVPYEPEGKS